MVCNIELINNSPGKMRASCRLMRMKLRFQIHPVNFAVWSFRCQAQMKLAILKIFCPKVSSGLRECEFNIRFVWKWNLDGDGDTG